jgi:hypothetical protein
VRVLLSSLSDPLPPKVAQLFRQAVHPAVYTDIEWFRLLSRETGVSPERCLIAALEDESDNPAATIVLERRNRSEHVPPTREIGSLANYYTCLFRPVTAREGDVDAIRLLISGLSTALGSVDVYDLLPLPDDEALLSAIEEGFRAARFTPVRYEAFGNWYEETRGDNFNIYLARRPASLCNLLRRKGRLAKRAGAEFEIIADLASIEAAIDAYEAIYRTSWKDAEPHPSFMPAFIRYAGSRGILRVGLCRLAGQPVAGQLWLVEHGRATVYKLAHDQRASHLSVGSLLTAEMMRYVIEQDHAVEVDFGRGDDAYKRLWVSSRRSRWGILAAANFTWRGIAARFRHATLPRLVRRLRSRPGPNVPAGPSLK